MNLSNYHEDNHRFDFVDVLNQKRDLEKRFTKPSAMRLKYQEVYEWSKKQLTKFEKFMLKAEDNEISIDMLQEEKKVILSMLLEIGRLCKQECLEKGLIVEQMLNYAINFLNQHQKYYDILSYRQIKHFQNCSIELEKQYKQKNQGLHRELTALKTEKHQKWKNLFMVVKDNRVLRRQKAKLIRLHKQQAWKIQLLQQDLISLRSENQKYKILLETFNPNEAPLKTYVSNQILLSKLDQKIKQYPSKARRVLKKELIELETNQLSTLEHRIKFIIQSLEQNNDVCEELDDWVDDAETTRLFYNVSVQTYIECQSVGTNTFTPVISPKVFQNAKNQTRPRDVLPLQLELRNLEIKILPTVKRQVGGDRKNMSMTFNNKLKRRQSTNFMFFDRTMPCEEGKPWVTENYRLQIMPLVYNIKILETKKRRSRMSKNFTSIVVNVSESNNDLRVSQSSNSSIINGSNSNQELNKNKIKVKHLNKKPEHFTRREQMHFSGKSTQRNSPEPSEKYLVYEEQKKKSKSKHPNKGQINCNNKIYQVMFNPKNSQEHESINQQVQTNRHGSMQVKQTPSILQLQPCMDNKQKEKSTPPNENEVKHITHLNHHEMYRRESVVKGLFYKNKAKAQAEAIAEEVQSSVTSEDTSSSSQSQQESLKKSTRSKKQKENAILQQKSNNLTKSTRKAKVQQIKRFKSQTKRQPMPKVQKQNNKMKQIDFINTLKKHRRQYTDTSEIVKARKENFEQKPSQFYFRMSSHSDRRSEIILSNSNEVSLIKENLPNKRNSKLQKLQFRPKMELRRQSKDPILSQIETVALKTKAFEERFFISGQKLLQKLLSNIFNRRKQIISNPQNCRSFINNFLSALFGNRNNLNASFKKKPILKFFNTLKESLSHKSNNLYICLLFEKFVPLKGCEMFTEDIFVLFALMLEKLSSLGALPCISNIFSISKEYCLKVIEYLCSIYFSPEQTKAFIKEKIERIHGNNGANMLQLFIILICELENIVYSSELWDFFESKSIPSWASENLSESQIAEFVTIFSIISAQGELHMRRISYYASKYFPLHRFCLYAYRYNWEQVYSINSWLHRKYVEYFDYYTHEDEQFDVLSGEIEKQLSESKKFQFLLRNFKLMSFRHKKLGVRIDWSYLKLCRLTVVISKMDSKKIFPENLNCIQQAYRKQMGKLQSKILNTPQPKN